MANPLIALIRHGQYQQLPDTPSAHQPFPLTRAGIQEVHREAEKLSDLLSARGWALAPEVDCSSLLRAWQTAEIFIEVLRDRFTGSPSLYAFDALSERGLGSAANLSIRQIEAAVEQDPRCSPLPVNWKSNSHFRLPLPGAESLMQAGHRVADHLRTHAPRGTVEPAQPELKLCFGHGAAFRHAAYILGVLPFEQIARLSMYHAHPVVLEAHRNGDWQHIEGQWKERSKTSAYTD